MSPEIKERAQDPGVCEGKSLRYTTKRKELTFLKSSSRASLKKKKKRSLDQATRDLETTSRAVAMDEL